MKARVSVKRTRYPWDPSRTGQWMWRCLALNDCSEWHYDVDDLGFGDNYSDVLRKALAHTEIEHVQNAANEVPA